MSREPFAADDDGNGPRTRIGYLRAAVALTLIAVAVWFAWSSMTAEALRDIPVQPISVLDLPPLEEPEELEYEEPDLTEELVEEEVLLPDAMDDVLGDDIDDSLGLDAEGSGGSDAFGLKAKRGGRSLLDAPSDAEAGYGRYAVHVATALERVLNRLDRLKLREYVVELKLWVDSTGHVSGAQLVRGSGEQALDDALVEALSTRGMRFDPPPPALPQPVRIRIRTGQRSQPPA